jgi:purine nucleosidase
MAEWNIRVDPEAASEVFAGWAGQQQLPIVCGLNLTRRVAMTPDILAALATDGASAGDASRPSPLIRMIEDAMRFYFESHRDRGHGYVAYMHDPLAAAVALDPQLVSTRAATVDVELADTRTRGVTTADWSGSRKPNALIGVDVDPAVFFDRFIEQVGPFARRLG